MNELHSKDTNNQRFLCVTSASMFKYKFLKNFVHCLSDIYDIYLYFENCANGPQI